MCLFVVFDLLRVCVQGFLGFTAYFSQEYSGNFIGPVRLSDSAVETLFSQFKHTGGSKLISTNYFIINAAHLEKHSVSYYDGSKRYQDLLFIYLSLS